MKSGYTHKNLRTWEAGPDGLELLAFGTRVEGDADFVPGWWTD